MPNNPYGVPDSQWSQQMDSTNYYEPLINAIEQGMGDPVGGIGTDNKNNFRTNIYAILRNMGVKPGDDFKTVMQKIQNYGGSDQMSQHVKSWVMGNSDKLQSMWPGGAGGAGGAGGTQAGQTDPSTDWYNNAMQRISDFANKMSQYDPNDPLAKSLGNIAFGQGAGAVGAAGFGSGGISQNAGQRAYADSQTRYQMERQNMAQGALQSLQQGALAGRGQDIGQQQFNQQFGLEQAQFQNQLAQQAYGAQLGQNQAIGSALGGALGTVAGAYFGVPGLGQAGSQLGGGLGGYATGAYKPPMSTGYSGSGGGYSYGGGQSSYGFSNY